MKQKEKDNFSVTARPSVEAVLRRVREVVEPLCMAEGLDLVHVEFQREPAGRILRLYIDKPGGVSLDDCVRFSRQVSDLLDAVLDDGIGPYNLEVSSPGRERPLSREVDFQRFAGHSVRLRVRHAMEGQKNFTGRLAGVADGKVTLDLDGRTVTIGLQEIVRARLMAG